MWCTQMKAYGILMHEICWDWSTVYIHSSCEKSLIERVNQYLMDRTEGFDHHYPCRRQGYKLLHVKRC
jgi:hypothetical protein